MAVTIQTIDIGTVPGDSTGDTARVGGNKINLNFSELKTAVDLVLDIPEGYLIGRITASTGDPEKLSPTQVRSVLELPQQSGFIDRADSTISFVNGTRTFSIAPSATSFQYWQGNTKYTISAQDDIVITDVEGLHYIYYDGTTLTHTTTFTEAIITDYAFISAIYWDATNNASVILADERHGYQMDAATHIYNHNTFGARYGDGLGLGNINTSGTGNAAGDAQFSVASGSLWDEDIQLVITDGSPQTLSTAAELPIVYRSGASGDWRLITATSFPLTTTGTGMAAWNEWTGATWQLTETTSGNYLLYHYYATGDTRWPVIAIPGIAEYSSLANAQAAAPAEIHGLTFGALDLLTPEMIPIATVIYETKSSFTNAVKSRTRVTADGDDYIDWRGTSGGGTGGSGGGTDIDPNAIHVNAGTEIQPITAKGTPVAADVLVIEDSAASWAKKSIAIGNISHDILADYVANEHIDWTSASENLSTSGTLSGSNLSGSNTGDQSSIVGITGTLAEFNTACTNATFATGGGTVTGTSSGTNTGDQTSIAGITGTMTQFDTACTDGNFSYSGHTHTFASITSKPTTLAGYAISDTTTNFNNALSDGSFAFAGGAFHDGFSDYDADEHRDWTVDQGATVIHAGNYTNTTYAANDFNHNDLANVPVNDHIDWTVDQGATNIHSGNYTDTVYSLPLATATVRGGIELYSNTDNPTAANAVTSTASRTYGLQLNAANQGVINVPWTDTVYSHPSHPGDDAAVDTGALTGANVISDLDFNITTDTLGHVTDANATVATRALTLANLGYTGDTNANNYVHPTTSGNKHVPSGGSAGQILGWASDGTASWQAAASGYTFELTAIPAVGDWDGQVARIIANQAIAIGQVVSFLGNTQTPYMRGGIADADFNRAVLGIAVSATTGAGQQISVLTDGWYRGTTSLIDNGQVFLSTSAGVYTQTPPSASGDFVHVIGRAGYNNILWVKPSATVVEIA